MNTRKFSYKKFLYDYEEKSQGINCTNGHKYIYFIENILNVLHIKSANLFHFILKIKVKNLI